MSAVKAIVFDGGMQRTIETGDVMSTSEPTIPATDTTNTTLSYTAANLLSSSVYVRNPAGVSTDTFPTADALVTALAQINGSWKCLGFDNQRLPSPSYQRYSSEYCHRYHFHQCFRSSVWLH